MKTVLLTGGLGYVGGRLTQTLLANGIHVRISTRRTPEQIPEWAKTSVELGNDVSRLCNGADAIIHMAAPNEIRATNNPDACIRETNKLTQSAIAGAIENNVKQFVYFSTVHVYGHLKGAIDEDQSLSPIHPYAIAHAQSEEYVRQAKKDGINSIVLRLSNGFGAPADPLIDRWTLLVNDLCKQAVYSDTLQLSTRGFQKRDFITLDDICGACLHLLMADKLSDQQRVYNISSATSVSIQDMAERIRVLGEAKLGKSLKLSFGGAGPTEPDDSFVIQNTRLQREGFEPKNHVDAEIDGLLGFCLDHFG